MPSALESLIDLEVQEEVDLSQHTSFAIGGPAAAFVTAPSSVALASILVAANKLDLNTLILGGGTNLLVSDDGFEGLVIRLDLNRLSLDKEAGLIHVGASVNTAALVEQLIADGFAGLEFAAGLPGTIGGGIAGNAGCFGHTLSDFLVRATVVDVQGAVHEIADREWFHFQYRHSKLLGNRMVLTEATFAVRPGNAGRLRKESDKYLAVRAEKHPRKGVQTAGSYFKNLPPEKEGQRYRAAGALLDQVGARDLSVGDAAVFDRHANIIVNRGHATAKDVLTLAKQMKQRVHERFGVALTEEVRFVGQRPAEL